MRAGLPFLALAAVLSGCWSFDATPYPEAAVLAAGENAKNLSVKLADFAALEVDYAVVSGYQTYYSPGYFGRRHWHSGYVATVPTTTYVPQSRTTDAYLRRAQDQFEQAGFIVAAGSADRTVEVHFDGPFESRGDTAIGLAWNVFTLFLCDYRAVEWKAKLRIRDAKSGKLIFHHDYVQRFETKVFSPIPLFGIASCEETSGAFLQAWCLSALTDRAVADATAFLSK